MKNIPLTMERRDLYHIPEHTLPEGFQLKLFKKGDEQSWAEIETSAGEFAHTDAALDRFYKEFGPYREEMSQRCLFIENSYGEKIGTATAWRGDLDESNRKIGRIHWVGIMQKYQGMKLSKPLLSAALKQLSQFHSKAYLTSQTTSFQAVNMYLNYGFEPYITSAACKEAWSLLEQVLQRKIL
ncbi:MAG TPA: GNAT family N-acetyltransferase [Pseudogracilibacillus sp.]|nr:GNAT family N-acetyltransferase [Pseudogracilibacillus sp.]